MDIRHLTVFVYRTRFFLRQSPSDVKQEKQMSSILDDQLRLMALKQYGLIKSIKTPDISNADLLLILKNTENETIKQLAAEKLLKNPDIYYDIYKVDLEFILKNTENETIKQLAAEKLLKETNIYDLYKVDYELILKSTENETIKQLATEKLQYLNSHPRLGVAGAIARANRLGRFHSESTKD